MRSGAAWATGLLLGLAGSPALAFFKPQSGLSGITFNPYEPLCAHGCYRVFSTARLQCYSSADASGYSHHLTTASVPACRAVNWAYMSSVAWCIHTLCPPDVTDLAVERFWEAEITGDASIVPSLSYSATLLNLTEPPTEIFNATLGSLNKTMLAKSITGEMAPLVLYYREQQRESIYGVVILTISVGLPVLLTWLGYLPFMTGLLARVKPWLYGAVFGTYHERPLPWGLGNLPTLGQALFITVIVALNIALTAAAHEIAHPYAPNQWFKNRYQETVNRAFNRTGVLAFAMLPVLLLFSSRNNVLLWMTNWSHSTYLLLHRWVARIFAVHVILHSIFGLCQYVSLGTYAATAANPWWRWGIVATVMTVAIMLQSVLFLRRRSYELFLVIHIVLSVLCLVGCWYHVVIRFSNRMGYETWLYVTFAVWGFDRLVRVGRILKAGVRRATVTDLGAEIVRIDIPGIRWAAAPGHHAYVYFPTLNPLRPWENHPFSIIPTAMLAAPAARAPSDADDAEKTAGKPPTMTTGAGPAGSYRNDGMTLFVRKSAGLTGSLGGQPSVLTLLEGPYPNSPTRAVLESDRLLLVGGGIGLASLLPYLRLHANARLLYSARAADACLVDAVPLLRGLPEAEVRVGARLDLEALLAAEVAAGWARVGVVCCGPAGMCDDVRADVARLGRENPGVALELEVDSFAL
ncbi:ferric-chelate reductase [Immersiella caudata]|uniref:Ferric-chelate reductase n=1 Tax=Immersiella caudata TaxID=314043 RepID=A0AA39X512_9PEZI|nr:ferric-chelate reductase [Immersiella caudata]